MKNNKRDGFGVRIWSDGSQYDGLFKEGLPDGHGVYKWGDGSVYKG